MLIEDREKDRHSQQQKTETASNKRKTQPATKDRHSQLQKTVKVINQRKTQQLQKTDTVRNKRKTQPATKERSQNGIFHVELEGKTRQGNAIDSMKRRE